MMLGGYSGYGDYGGYRTKELWYDMTMCIMGLFVCYGSLWAKATYYDML